MQIEEEPRLDEAVSDVARLLTVVYPASPSTGGVGRKRR